MSDPLVHWWDILQDSRYAIPAKSRWKILREGADLDAHLSRAPFKRNWSIVAEHGDVSRGAIKCLIQSVEFGDECEMVVLFPKLGRRATVCVSSQIGCAVGCRFCSTGTMGLRRNLSSQEILEQVYVARCIAMRCNRSLRNVVFMGMGEPMHNCRAVWDSLRGMMGVDGFGLSPRSITVSTAIGAGLLVETATRFPGVRLALSLHAADAELRKDLVPHSPSEMERTKEVVQAINEIQNGEPVWLELTMLKGVNDRPQDLESLVRFTSGLNVQVNLIPFNSMRRPLESNDGKSLPLAAQHGDLESTPLSEIYTIAQELRSRGLVVRVRHSFGDQDNAACGQLVLSSSRTPETLAEW